VDTIQAPRASRAVSSRKSDSGSPGSAGGGIEMHIGRKAADTLTSHYCSEVVEVGAPLAPLPTMLLLPSEIRLLAVVPTPSAFCVMVVPEI
jgi:hypothetical protein